MYEELIKRLRASVDGRNEKCDGCPYEEDYPCCVDCLDKMHKQAADAIEELSKRARPVVRGKWKFISFMTVECSNCQETFHELEGDNFCPNCGADMRPEPPKEE